jgi:hypothetical protein
MKIVLKIVGGLAALVLLLVLVAFLFPRHYRVERSALFNAKPETIHAQIADLRAWKSWGVWQQRDPGMKLSYSEPAKGVGAWSAWISAKEGSGKMTITQQTPTVVAYALEFPDFGTKSNASLTLAPEGTGTRVTWMDEGDLGLNPMNRWFGLFLEKLLAPDFEQSLANLKRIVEA